MSEVRRLVGDLVISTVRLLDNLEKMKVQPPAEVVDQLGRLAAVMPAKAIEAAPTPKQMAQHLTPEELKATQKLRGQRAAETRVKKVNELAMRLGPGLQDRYKRLNNWGLVAAELNKDGVRSLTRHGLWSSERARWFTFRYQELTQSKEAR
jgi:hypothetical protein